ncbi:hypothetical protein ACOSP7_007615 [Xanthoceras sorbifolium]
MFGDAQHVEEAEKIDLGYVDVEALKDLQVWPAGGSPPLTAAKLPTRASPPAHWSPSADCSPPPRCRPASSCRIFLIREDPMI